MDSTQVTAGNQGKVYLQASDVYKLSMQLAAKVYRDGFKPDFIVALWRGGAAVGMNVQGFLAHKGINSDHVAIRTSSYDNTQTQRRDILVHSIGHLKKQIGAHHTVLIVDDVFDSGRTIQAFIAKMKEELRDNFPKTDKQVRVAALYYKPKNNKTERKPEYFIDATDRWLVFPHELEDLSEAEIREHYPEAAAHLFG